MRPRPTPPWRGGHVLAARLLATASLALEACHPKPRGPTPTAVRVESVTRAPRTATARYSGTVEARTQVDLAFRFGGYVQSLATTRGEPRGEGRPLQPGDPVSKRQVLATLRQGDFKQRLTEAGGLSAEAAASHRRAAADLARAKRLFAENAIAQAEYDAVKARHDALGGQAAAAAARVGQAGLALADSELRSPLDGIVLERRAEVGALVTPGVALLTVADTSQVKVRFGVPDTVQSTLAPGAPVVVTADGAPDRRFVGAVTAIAAQADPRTRSFDVEASVDNRDGALKVGMVATLELGRPTGDPELAGAVLVPLSAVVRGGDDGFAVFVVRDGGGRAVARTQAVSLGDLVASRVAVTGGLDAGERIVVQGATFLVDGQPIVEIPGSVGGEPTRVR